MKPTLKIGDEHVYSYRVPEDKTVPYLFSEDPICQSMPKVLATGFLVGLIEVTCAQALTKHLEEGEGSLGIHVNLSHTSPTPPGMTVEVRSKVIEVDGNKITFEVVAKDEMDVISEGTHRRFVVNWDRFQSKIDGKKKG